VFSNIQSNETPADSSSPDNNENAEEDIQAYMNRLLNRSASTTQPEQASPTLPVAGAPVAQTEQPKPREVVQVLSEEEFVPTHKATRPENYDTLREIANTTSRTAIEHSTKNVKKGGLLKVVLAFVLFTFAAAAYLMMSGVLDDSVKENPSEATVQQTVDK
jgi:isochorismate synthase EntC